MVIDKKGSGTEVEVRKIKAHKRQEWRWYTEKGMTEQTGQLSRHVIGVPSPSCRGTKSKGYKVYWSTWHDTTKTGWR